MVVTTNKRATMTLYSGGSDHYSQRVRIVLAEKGVTFDLLDIESMPKASTELAELNPYGAPPVLIDRDLVLYQSEIIMEYLDERFPHPPLMPVYPIARGRSRLMLHRINRDWCTLVDRILQLQDTDEANVLRQQLIDSIVSVTPVFAEMPYFLSEEFSLVDCCIAPLFWRLPVLNIELPAQAKPILAYADRMFERESFQSSLTDTERAMRK